MTDKSEKSRQVEGSFTWDKNGTAYTADGIVCHWSEGAWVVYATLAPASSSSHQAFSIIIPAESPRDIIDLEFPHIKLRTFQHTFVVRDQHDYWPRTLSLEGKVKVYIHPRKGEFKGQFEYATHNPEFHLHGNGTFNLTLERVE
jgi:hypothetical protein